MTPDFHFGLKPETLTKIRDVLDGFQMVDKCVIYGSRAMGNYRYNSDIDLCLVGEKLSLTELLKIENKLDDLLLPYQIDLSIFHQIDNPELVKHIIGYGKTLYDRNRGIYPIGRTKSNLKSRVEKLWIFFDSTCKSKNYFN